MAPAPSELPAGVPPSRDKKRAVQHLKVGCPILLLHRLTTAQPPLTALQVCTQEFSRDRKMMSVLCASAEGATMFVKGAPEAVLASCTSVRENRNPVTVM